ncbi:penicillin-binding transpeptidase domain-containing protein [Chloroflexota bacterium]
MTGFNRSILAVLLVSLVCTVAAGCNSETPTPIPSTPTPAPTLAPTPTVEVPPADEIASAFLAAWEQGDYEVMYDLLSTASQERYSEEDFSTTYRQVASEAKPLSISSRLLAAYQPGTEAEITFDVSLDTALFGELVIENHMSLTLEEGRWYVNWTPAMIFPQMRDGTFVRLTTEASSRGNIYDRNGLGLAIQGLQVEVGVVPALIEDEAVLLANLSTILARPHDALQDSYANVPSDWYVPLGRISAEQGQAYYDTLTSLPGVELREAWSRSYRPEIVAPHVVGIVGPIPAAEVEMWRAEGYTGEESVGQMGLERWGEPYLAAERSARLEIVTSTGQQIAVLADRPAQENSSLYTTFDREFQKEVQDILGETLGAIAVLEAQTGRVLALATYPMFDPNPFAVGMSAQDWSVLQSDGRRPLVNRATQGTYPAGSVFKVVTMIAGMEAGGLAGNSTFICRGTWRGLGADWLKTCWSTTGHGSITLKKALSASCDITFYQVGLALNGVGTNVLPDYALSSGFGAKTGIEIEEEPGQVPDPAWKIQNKGEGWAPGDAVNLAIGQGDLLTSPLQVAMLMAAVGNGGTLYRPNVVEMIASDPKAPKWVFEPTPFGQLPVTAENLAVIQNSLHKVTSAAYGTAYEPFKGLEIAVAGKTGTAESGRENPHAWFAGYVPADNPEIAIAVIVEHSGEGSKFAAPLFRRVVEAYFASD